MSSLGKTVSSNLPEDVEERIAYIQESISLLERKNIRFMEHSPSDWNFK